MLKDNNFREENLTKLDKYIYPEYHFAQNFVKMQELV